MGATPTGDALPSSADTEAEHGVTRPKAGADAALLEAASSAAVVAIQRAKHAIETLEGRSLQLRPALELLLGARGRVIVTGVGKSAVVAKRIAATFSSTGTAAQYLHATDALHGELGAITAEDVIIALSRSGETGELCQVAQHAQRRGVPVLGMVCGGTSSELARLASLTIDVGEPVEGDPYEIVPTSSATAMAVVGDALAVALMVANGRDQEQYKANHPGGGPR